MKRRAFLCFVVSIGIALCSTVAQQLPDPVKGVPVSMDSVIPPEVTRLHGEFLEYDANPNVHPVGPTLTRRLPSNLKVVTLGKDGVPGPRTIEATFKKIPVRYPDPVTIEEPRVQRDAHYTIKSLTEDEGLRAATITSLLEDSRGHLWIAADRGGNVCRHDGERLACFGQENGFPLTWGIRNMLEDRQGRIWFSGEKGVCFYDGHDFWHFEHDDAEGWDNIASGLLEDRNGNIWFSYGDVYCFSGNEFTIYDRDIFPGVAYLLEDRYGHIWMSIWGKGVLRFDGRQVVYITEDNGLVDNRIGQMKETAVGELWFGSGGFGLSDAKGVSRLIPDPEPTPLPAGTLINYSTDSGLSGNRTTAIEEDKYGRVWISTFKHGLTRFDPGIPGGHSDQFVHIGEIQGLIPDQLSLLVGRNNVVWAGANGNGLNQIVLSGPSSLGTGRSLIDQMRATGIAEDEAGQIWLAPDYEGLIKFDGETFQQIGTDNGFPPDWIMAIETDTKGNLWIGTRDNGVLKFDGRRVTRYGVEQGLTHPQVDEILVDRDGMVWVSCFNGAIRKRAINRLDPSTSEITRYSGTSQNDNIGAADIHQDRDGSLWFGGKRGVATYNAERDQLQFVATLDEGEFDWMKWFVEDDHGNLWVARTDMFGEEAVEFFQLKADGRVVNADFPVMEKGVHWPNIGLSRLALDANGHVWLSSESGLFGSREDLRTMARGDANWVNLTRDDGLKGNRIGFIHVDASNRLWIDHQTMGMTLLDLDAFEFPDQTPPDVGLIQLEIGGDYIDFRSIFNDTLTDEIRPLAQAYDSLLPFANLPVNPSLPYEQNHLTFHFSAAEWSAPHIIEYSYMLEGLEDDWSLPGPASMADYRQIPPGSYTFKVRARGAGNSWSRPSSYAFRILPPWWQTPWAYAIYILLVAGSIGGYILRLRRRIRMKQEQLEREQYLNRELRELNIATTRFVPKDFVNILDKKSLRELKLGDQIDATMTVLFADIRDYMLLSEGMSPDENFRFINAYVGRMGPIIREHGGFICQYYGDGIMALFKENHHKAIQASIDMHKKLDQYNQERLTADRKPVSIGIGLNTGHLMLGVIGDQRRYDTSVISDAVNTASRLEGLTKIFGAQIIVSEKTLHEIQNAEQSIDEDSYLTSVRFLGKVKVKGKDRVLKIYEVFEGEPALLYENKLKTKVDFERAIRHYFDKKFGKSAETLKKILELSPDDRAARYYLDRCVKFIVDGVEENWSGVEEMVIK